jgi:hypothetical protein
MKKILQLTILVIAFLTVLLSNAQYKEVGETFVSDGVTYTVTTAIVDADPANEILAVAGEVGVGDEFEIGQPSEAPASYSGTELATVVVPASVMDGPDTYSVTSVVLKAFAGNTSMTSIDLSALSITSIAQQAFYNTDLTTFILPSSVTQLGRACFQNSSGITSINTSNLTDLGQQSAMGEMGALTSVDFGMVTNIGKRSFRGSNSITSLALPSITDLGDSALNSTSLETLAIGENLTNLNGNAFDNLPALSTLIWDVEDPATFNPSFASSSLNGATLAVPAANLMAYTENAFWSNLFGSIVAKETLSTSSIEQELGLVLYPNPTNRLVNIKNNYNTDVDVIVYDINGRALIETTNSQIDMTSLSSGLYVFRLKTEKGELVKRILKQ